MNKIFLSRSFAAGVLTASLVCPCSFAGAEAARLRITPESGLVDEPFHVVLDQVLPGTRVTVTASRPDNHDHTWTAVGEYAADAAARIDLDLAPSLGGSYEGVSPHGLWCAALPVAPAELSHYLADLPRHPELGTAPSLDADKPYVVSVVASVGGKTIATGRATRTYSLGGKPEEVSVAGGVRGLYFPAPANVKAKVPVVVVAGSGGGVPQLQAALLASHGHPALAQGIFGYKDLPSTLKEIPLETFRAGAKWLKQRTHAGRVAIMGTSRGSEAAGLAASYFPDDFAAAVVYVPSHLTNGAFGPGITDVVAAWTYAGKPLAADRGETDSNNADAAPRVNKPPGFVGTPYYLSTWSDPAVSAQFGIPYERMRGPVLALGAGADQMWPSFIGAEGIRRRLAAHGKANQAEIHIYPGAGHMVARLGTGGPLSSFVFHPVAKDFEATGGLPNANCEDSYDAWRTVLRFLEKIQADEQK